MALQTFGKRLKFARMERDLTQIALRDQMEGLYGVSIGETYISELERTDRMPSLEVAAAMAKVLDVSIDYLGLLIGEPVSWRRQEAVDNYISEEADAVAKLVDEMRPEQRFLVLNLAKSIAGVPTQRQREDSAIHDMLGSIERNHGRIVRREIEQILRDRGILIDS